MSFLSRAVNKNCTCNTRFLRTLSNIRHARTGNRFDGESDEDYKNRGKQEWYQNACNFDKHTKAGLFVSSSVIGGVVSTYLTSEHQRCEEDAIVTFVGGNFAGGLFGTVLGYAYPYPKIVFGTLGIGLYITQIPLFLYKKFK